MTEEELLTFRAGTGEDLRSGFTKDQNLDEEEMPLKICDFERHKEDTIELRREQYEEKRDRADEVLALM